MRICVTGGAGFIGHHAVRALRKVDHEVAVVDNLSTGRGDRLPPEVPLQVADVLEDSGTRAILGCRPEAVLHLAARVTIRGSVDDFVEDARQNLMGTARALEAAIRAGARRFVLASSMAVYDDAPSGLLIGEDWPTIPSSPYGISKLAAEQLVHLMGRRSGISTLALRFFNTFGSGQRFTPYVGVITIFVHRILAGQPVVIYGDGNQTRDFVSVADVSRACVLALQSTASGLSLNVGTGVGTTVNQVADLLRQRMGSRLPPEFAAPRAEETRNSVADITLVRRALGYEPGSGLADRIGEVIEDIACEVGGTAPPAPPVPGP
jgi:UDP-glucose 4-epimerase